MMKRGMQFNAYVMARVSKERKAYYDRRRKEKVSQGIQASALSEKSREILSKTQVPAEQGSKRVAKD